MSDRELPSPIALFQASLDAIVKNPAGYLLAGLGPTLIAMPLGFGMVVFVYGAAFVGLAPGLFLESEILALGGVVTALLVGFGVVIVGSMVLLAPLYASLMRAIAAAQDGQGTLGFGSAFSSVGRSLPKVVGVYGATGLLSAVGALLCVVPGLIASWVLEFAVPAVVLDEVSPAEGLARSIRHVRAHPGWSASVFAIAVAIMMVLTQIPLVGYMVAAPLAFDFQIRAYRAAFPST